MRTLMLAFFMLEAVVNLGVVSTASARTDLSREQIKAMPITQRPNRAGHFYGNTVRRRDRRG